MSGSRELQDLNEALASVPCAGEYDLQATLADRRFHVRSEGGRLLVEELQLEMDMNARTAITVDSLDTLRKLADGGRAASLGLMARGRLCVDGDVSQIEELQAELQPHAARLEPAASALLQGGEPAVVRWVPDDAAPRCMAPACGERFSLLRRRHHCRACGEVFCRRCVTKVPYRGERRRTCAKCFDAGRAAAPLQAPALATAGLPSGRPTVAPEPVAAAPARTNSSNDWLAELQVEKAVGSIRILSSAAVSAWLTVLVLAAWTYPPSRETWQLCGVLALVLIALHKWILRYSYVGWVCSVIALNVLQAKWLSLGRGKQAEEAAWEMCHRVNARFIFDSVVTLGGFWVKMAQTASVISMMPEIFGEELTKLQDAMPADSMKQVQWLLRQELGKDWQERVVLHPGPPIGSATIAQVHRATFRVRRNGGDIEEVQGVLKVQHKNMKASLLIDVYASGVLAKLMCTLVPHLFSDLQTVLKDLAAITIAELDFRKEAANQAEARAALLKSDLNVIVPQVFDEFVTRRLLGMEYIDGIKITDLAGAPREERHRLVSTLIDYYGYTMHGPIFNMDPHPGNLLVERETGRLCVLDWGQARRNTPAERRAFAKVFLAASMKDTHLMIEGCTELGFKFGDPMGKPDAAPPTVVDALRFLLRDSKPAQQSRQEMKKLEEQFSRLSGDLRKIQQGGEQVLKGALMPLSKTSVLLYEVSGLFSISLPLLHVLTGHGYQMLLRDQGHSAAKPHGTSFILEAKPMRSLAAPLEHPLRAKMETLLQQLHANGELLAAQLCVLDVESGKTLADVALGHTSWLAPAPVDSGTVFNIMELSKLYLALSVLRLVDERRLSLSTVLSSSGSDAEGVTVEHALAHTSGLMHIIPPGAETFRDLCDLPKMMARIATTKSLLPPGARQQYHHTSFGLLLARACQLAGTDVEAAWSGMVSAALGPQQGHAMSMKAPSTALARPCRNMSSPCIADFAANIEEFEFFLSAILRGKEKEATAAEKADSAVCMSTFGKAQWIEPSAFANDLMRTAVLPGLQAFCTARTAAEVLRAAARKKLLRGETLAAALRSRQPAASGPEAKPARLVKQLGAFIDAEWGLGIQLVRHLGRPSEPEALPGSVLASSTGDSVASTMASTSPEAFAGAAPPWGHVGANGSFALVLPGPRPAVAVLLLNRSDGLSPAKKVLAALQASLGRGSL